MKIKIFFMHVIAVILSAIFLSSCDDYLEREKFTADPYCVTLLVYTNPDKYLPNRYDWWPTKTLTYRFPGNVEGNYTFKIEVQGATKWKIECPADWITVSPSSGEGTAEYSEEEEITLTVKKNPSETQSRNATLTLTSQIPGYPSSGTIEVTQLSSKIDGHEYVDLGLPSGTMWATCNIGASLPEEYGEYFSWGGTKPQDTYYGSDCLTFCESTLTLETRGIIDSDGCLTSPYDAATVNWGSSWEMPTYSQFRELRAECTIKETDLNGISGYLFTGPNGNYLFLPDCGYKYGTDIRTNDDYYWTCNIKDGVFYSYASYSWGIYTTTSREYGCPVRAVVRP